MEKTLSVAEQFYSIQGEGRTMGWPAYFLRLAGCNLLCGGQGTKEDSQLHDGATWRCDTIEVWTKGRARTFENIIEKFGSGFVDNVASGKARLIVTGGEPLLQDKGLTEFLDYLRKKRPADDLEIEVETNGTILPSKELFKFVTMWNISPKLSNSGMTRIQRFKAPVMSQLIDKICTIKFVVKTFADVQEVLDEWCFPLALEPKDIHLMPAADNMNDLQYVSRDVAEWCKEYGFKFSSRLHVAIWNQKTGV